MNGFLRTLMLVVVASCASSPARAIDTAFTYQGVLKDAGVAAEGPYDFEFRLQTSAGIDVGAPAVRNDVPVSAGVFTVTLDYGPAITSANFQLRIAVRHGASTGAYTVLSPATPITPAPQAQVSGLALEAATAGPNSVSSASVIDGSLGVADINTGQVQARVSTACTAGNALTQINANGAVVCQPLGTGDITGVTAAAGLLGGGSAGAVALSVDGATVQSRVSGACPAGSSIRQIDAAGTVVCQPDTAGSGDITDVLAGAGLTGGGATGSVTLGIPVGGITNALVADDAITTGKIAAGGVNSSDIASGAVTMAKISTPTGSATAMSLVGAFRVFPSGAINFAEPGTCLVIAQAVSYGSWYFGMRPILLHTASNNASTPPAFSGSVQWEHVNGSGKQVNAAAVLSPTALGESQFGCELLFAPEPVSCHVSWMCN